MMAWGMASMWPPVERSMTVSAPRWTAVCSFSSSSSILLVTAELPMLALILQAAATPMHIGSSRFCRWTVLAGMTMRPRATSSRISSGARSSRAATKRMASVIEPVRAASSWVMSKSAPSSGWQEPGGGVADEAPQRREAGDDKQRHEWQQDVERKHAQPLEQVFQGVDPENKPDGQGQVRQQEDQVDLTDRQLGPGDEQVSDAERDQAEDG